MILSWETNFGGSETRVFRGKIIAGLLKVNAWKSTGYGELDGHLVRFKTKGFFKRKTEILDIEGERVLGTISYRLMKSQATIVFNDKNYEWAFTTWLQTKWSVVEEEGRALFEIKSFWGNSGEIENEGISPVIVLTSLYIRNHFRQIAAASGAA